MAYEAASSTSATPAPAGRPRPRRWLIAAVVVLILALMSAAAWRSQPRSTPVYTDGRTLRVPAARARVRDVLWKNPVSLGAAINIAGDDYEPTLSADGQELFFVRGKTGGGADIYQSRRAGDAWSQPTPLAALNSAADDLGPHLSADGLTLYFYSDRPGGAGGYDLWAARRNTRDTDFTEPFDLGARVNSPWDEYSPAPAPDGLLYFASNRPAAADAPRPEARWSATVRADGARRDYNLYVAPLNDAGVGTPQPLGLLNTAFDEGTPAISPVGDFLYFSSNRPGGAGGYDLYRVRVTGAGGAAVERLAETVNSAANELDPALGMDGFALYFSSDRRAPDAATATDPHYDIYQTASREVFTDADVLQAGFDWSGWWVAVAPGLLALLFLLLLLFVAPVVWNALQRRRLSLMMRCLLASALLHLLLLMLFTVWQVSTSLTGLFERAGGVRVALTSSAQAADLAGQIRGGFTAPLESVEPPPLTSRPPLQRVVVEPSEDEPAAPSATRVAANLPVAEPNVADAHVDDARLPELAASLHAAELPKSEEFTPRVPEVHPHEAVVEEKADTAAAADLEPQHADLRTALLQPDVASSGLELARSMVGDSAVPRELDAGQPFADAAVPMSAAATPPDRIAAPAQLPMAALTLAVPTSSGPRAPAAEPRAESASQALPALRQPLVMALTGSPKAQADAELALPATNVTSTADPADTSAVSDLADAPAAAHERASREPLAMPLPPLADGPLELPRIESPPPPTHTITGVVVDAVTGAPIESAEVRLDRSDAPAVTAPTDADGAYALTVPPVPDFFVITASADGYLPASANVSAEAVRNRRLAVRFQLQPADLGAVAVEAAPDVHHLGDDNFEGRVNSQFQKRSEGSRYTASFALDARQAPPYVSSGEITMLTRGVQMPHPIRLNGQPVGLRLSGSPADGSFGEYRAAFDVSILHAGTNTLEIRALSRGSDTDDFEFVNIQIRLYP
ncbi:MAG TPA: carboxypeptidase regulatory-like domain-containing protein [Phycisphaerae bacterium]|nr:PD40 domain-containing protein [Phycisphaerales bacterium]HRX83408.1 carboxypeptidase regulatory-like domain-containing protein [Phycisphaerae bacterium]